MSSRIAVDCDHVLVDLNEGVRLFVNETYGQSHSKEDYLVTGQYKRYWERVWGLSDDVPSDRYAQFIKAGQIGTLQQMPNAITTLQELRKTYELVLVTARSELEADDTLSWLAKYAPGVFNDVVFTYQYSTIDRQATKGDICQALGASHLIDDNYDHCRSATEKGLQALLFGDYGWNREVMLPADMARVDDWNEVREYFAYGY